MPRGRALLARPRVPETAGAGSKRETAPLRDRRRHLAPTAPDTLPAYPFRGGDPFVLDDHPDVLFAGGAPHFATSLAVRADGAAATRVVALPAFAETGVAALVDLATLDVERLHFDVADALPAVDAAAAAAAAE